MRINSVFFFTVHIMNDINVQNMNNEQNNQDHFNVMRKIKKHPESSQRDLAQELGFSLGKLNYCLKALQQKGLIKIKNFQKNNNNFFPEKNCIFFARAKEFS